MKYTVEEIIKAIKDNNFGDTTITCPDGVDVVVKPCSYAEQITDIAQCDYFLVVGDMPWMGGSTIEGVVEEINRHAELRADLENQRAELRKYFEENEATNWEHGDWSWYSDWHKDLYGYRPHGHVCGEYVEPYPGACIRW